MDEGGQRYHRRQTPNYLEWFFFYGTPGPPTCRDQSTANKIA